LSTWGSTNIFFKYNDEHSAYKWNPKTESNIKIYEPKKLGRKNHTSQPHFNQKSISDKNV